MQTPVYMIRSDFITFIRKNFPNTLINKSINLPHEEYLLSI